MFRSVRLRNQAVHLNMCSLPFSPLAALPQLVGATCTETLQWSIAGIEHSLAYHDRSTLDVVVSTGPMVIRAKRKSSATGLNSTD